MKPLRLSIEKLLNNGYGLARQSDGPVVFVPGALPGESIAVSQLEKSKGVWWAREFQRLSSSVDRVLPDCPHATNCGGCQLLHIQPTREWRHKLAYLRDTLSRTASWNDVPVQVIDFPIDGSRIRGKLHARRSGRVGFKKSGSSQITSIHHCRVVPNTLTETLHRLEEIVKASGFVGDIFFAANPSWDQLILEAVGRCQQPSAWKPLLSDRSPTLSGVSLRLPRGRCLMSAGTVHQTFNWSGCQVSLSPSQFFQSNPLSWPIFLQRVRHFQDTHSLRNIWDVHAGSGFLSAALAPAKVLASEPEPRAFRQLTHLAKQARATIQPVHATAEATLAKERLDWVDGAILDPPREGLSNPLRNWLTRSGPTALLYFSCDLASFCRDLRELRQTYQPASSVLAMNLSPGTVKLELALSLIRKTSASAVS